MKTQKMITLDRESRDTANKMKNFSGWTREMLYHFELYGCPLKRAEYLRDKMGRMWAAVCLAYDVDPKQGVNRWLHEVERRLVEGDE